MAIHFYHPSKSIKGFAASFWRSDRDDTIFATLIKQSGWDDAAQNGTFKGNLDNPEGKVNIKLDYVEVAGILDCIERNRPFNNFHDNDEKPKNISFVPWMDKSNPDSPVIKGYSFSITVTDKQDSTYKNSFYIGLTFAEARLIREFLIFSLHSHFDRLRLPKSPQPVRTWSQTPPTQENATQPEQQADPLIDF